MDVEVVARLLSTLPEDDDHPYRTGPWRPQHTEWRADDLEVEGEMPADLDGVYLRNTENPVHPAIGRVPPVRRRRDAAHGRLPRRQGLLPQPVRAHRRPSGRAAGRWAAVGGSAERVRQASGDGAGARAPAQGRLQHRRGGAQRGGDCRATSSAATCTGSTRSPWTPSAHRVGRPGSPRGRYSAHPKVDEHTGELLFFNYSLDAPYLHYGVVDPRRHAGALRRVPLPGPRCRTTWRSRRTTRSSTTARCSGSRR